MRKSLLGVGLIILVIIDFLALDDITTGKEQSLLSEKFFLLISTPLLFVLGYGFHRSLKKSTA